MGTQSLGMKNIWKLIPVLFTIVTFFSCQKPTDDIIVQTPVTPTSEDSVTRLSKLIFIDTKVSVTDTTGIIEYLYDNLKRVTTINYYDYTHGISTPVTVVTYYYHGNDSIAFKKTEAEPEPYPTLETTFYSYDNINRLIKDSAIAGLAVSINNYIYSDSDIITNGVYFNPDISSDSSYLTITSYLGDDGNTAASIWFASIDNIFVDTFAYDNKPNPFDQLNISTTFSPTPSVDFYLYDNYRLNNNVLLASENDPTQAPAYPSVRKFNYTYDALGFPSMVDILENDLPAEEPRIIFIYKKM